MKLTPVFCLDILIAFEASLRQIAATRKYFLLAGTHKKTGGFNRRVDELILLSRSVVTSPQQIREFKMNIHVSNAVISVDANTVNQWLNEDNVVLVDVRETSEFDQEHIPGALLLPMSVFDPELFPKVPGKNVVLHCAIGKRSEAAGKMLLGEGHQNVIHLSGGLKAWKEAGFETEELFIPPAMPEKNTNVAPTNRNGVADSIVTARPGDVLLEEFMNPLELQAAELASAIGVEVDEISALINGSSAVTAELSLRLARYFCTDDDFWVNLQLRADLEIATQAIGDIVYNNVQPRLCA